MKTARLLLITALPFLLQGCVFDDFDVTGGDKEITGGVVDSSHLAVCALVYPPGPYEDEIFCTATLISTSPPRVLSAAHCMQESDGSETQPHQLNVAFGPSEESWELVAPVAAVHVHPDYNWNLQKASDIAFVDLDVDALSPADRAFFDAIEPIPANPNDIGKRAGEEWLFMGYGADNQEWFKQAGKGKYWWVGYGTKRSVYLEIAAVNPSDTHGTFDYYAKYPEGADPEDPYDQASNTCYGDSGGPAIGYLKDADTGEYIFGQNGDPIEVVMGVTSGGDADCGEEGSWGFDTRVDTFYDFVTGDGSPPEPEFCELGHHGDLCSSGADCCSGKCKGKPGYKTCKGG